MMIDLYMKNIFSVMVYLDFISNTYPGKFIKLAILIFEHFK